MPEQEYVVAGAAGSTALRSHFGASLEDHGPNVVLYQAGPHTARRAESSRGHDELAKAAPPQIRSTDLGRVFGRDQGVVLVSQSAIVVT